MTAFELQIIALILITFIIGVVIGYYLRTRVYPPAAASDRRGLTLESRQKQASQSLLRSGNRAKPRSSGQSATAAKKTSGGTKAATAAKKSPAPASEKPEKAPAPDNLQEIKGVGAVIEKKLKAMGVERFEQIAAWSETDIAAFDEQLNFRGRIQREKWVEQARELANRTSNG